MANISVYETIENSAVVQNAKKAWQAANKIGDTAAMEKARQTAENYRLTVGGYSTTDDGSLIKDIVNADVYNSVYNTVNNITDKIKNSAEDLLDKTAAALDTNTTTIIDTADSSTTYNPNDYTVTYTTGSSGSSTSFDTYLGYGVLGLIFIAVLSRFIDRK